MVDFTSDLIKQFRKSENKLLLLDYDGTLVPFTSTPAKTIPPPQLLALLITLSNKPRTKVVVISGRSYKELDKFLGHLPIELIAEHGAMIKKNGVWERQVIVNTPWQDEVLPILNQIKNTCLQSFIEEKEYSLTWHYRNSDLALGLALSQKLISDLEKIIHSHELKILDGNKIVEILKKSIGKGLVVKKIIEQNDFDYILAIGDDKTDEEMFEYLSFYGFANTIKVGKGSTRAKHRLEDSKEVLNLLNKL